MTDDNEKRVIALELSVKLAGERHGNDKLVNSTVIIADAVVFHRFLTRVAASLAPASG